MTYPMSDFLAAVYAEVERARERFPEQEETVPLAGWLGILVEEVGEVARDLNERLLGNTSGQQMRQDIRTELVQVAAMAALMFSAVEVQGPKVVEAK